MTDSSETHGHDSERAAVAAPVERDSRPSRRQVLTTVAGGLVCGAAGSRAVSWSTDSTFDETRQETAGRGSLLSPVAAETDASLSVQNTPATDTGGEPSAAGTSRLPDLSTLLVYAAAAVGGGAAGIAAVAGLLRLRQRRGSEPTAEDGVSEAGTTEDTAASSRRTNAAESPEDDDTTEYTLRLSNETSADGSCRVHLAAGGDLRFRGDLYIPAGESRALTGFAADTDKQVRIQTDNGEGVEHTVPRTGDNATTVAIRREGDTARPAVE
jgi:hypothetical protein